MSSRVSQLLADGCRTVVLTGAGISAESGVPTFRGADGLWRGFRPEELATPEAFRQDPDRVWAWYSWRRERVGKCRPNPAHQALARLEESGAPLVLITQNVDGLHRAAGSRDPLELHGCIWMVRCTEEGTVSEDRRVSLPEIPPRCACGALLRPHIVWFGEALDAGVLERALSAAREAELFLVVGTSGVVQPAALLPEMARSAGAHVVEINPDETPLTRVAHESLRGTAAGILPSLLGMEGA
jgi:NAD-dependent protein deacetylase/lipoamidase